MKPTRKLSLNTEHLTELSPAVLTGVAGGGAAPTQPLDPCVSIRHCQFTENLVRCLTNPCAD